MKMNHKTIEAKRLITEGQKFSATSRGGLALKRAADIFLVGLFMIPALPIMALTALAIRLESKGPVVFKQYRHGRDQQVFTVYKFRSMYIEKCTSQGGAQAKKDDDRITRIGRFIRKTSIDELPQFFNVLKGDMSLIGPRPHAVDHNEYYAQHVYQYWRRHSIRPGLTGWAQVNGFRGETKTIDMMADRVEADLDYIDNWSLWLDFKIVLLTFRELLFPRNAH